MMVRAVPVRFFVFFFFLLWLLFSMQAEAQVRTRKPLTVMEREKLSRMLHDANTGYDAAQFRLAEVFMKGGLVRRDSSEAEKWLRMAAGQGHVRAMYALAGMYLHGMGIKKDPVQAFFWASRLAEDGHRAAQFSLGLMYETGEGVSIDRKKARKWYDSAAGAASPSAIFHLRRMKEAANRELVSAPVSRAGLEARAEAGDADAQYVLGHAYLTGEGVPEDREGAAKWLLKAARAGHADAQYDAAYLFPVNIPGIPGDKGFREWTEKAALQGHMLAAFNLGVLYEHGSGVAMDWAQATRWYVFSGAMGNANAIRQLQEMEALCRKHPEKTQCTGFSLRNVVAELDAESLFRIGLALKDGDGIPQRYTDALFWLRYAADRNHPQAQYEVGDIYENALGVGRSAAQARFWYEKAAASGLAAARTRLDRMQAGTGREE